MVLPYFTEAFLRVHERRRIVHPLWGTGRASVSPSNARIHRAEKKEVAKMSEQNEASVQSVVHTPGPWIGWYRANEVEMHIRDKSGVLICKCYWPDEHRNAQLIAAAPELLAACELAFQDMARWGIFGPGRNAVESAIRKAKGE